MIAAVYRHGAPPALNALAAFLRENQKRELWRAYVADSLHMQCAAYLRGYKRPAYSEMTLGLAQPQDMRTGAQILEDLIGKLEGG